jgi:hypothetical protein
MYCSNAIVMDGYSGLGAFIFKVKPASATAFEVVGPKAAIRVSFCLKSED